MEKHESNGSKTISEAVFDGSLIDITDAAKKARIKCRTFLVASFWNGSLERSDEKLAKLLELISGLYAFVSGYEELGYRNPGPFCCLLEPNAEFGLVLVIGGPEGQGEMNFVRTTGEKIEYSM